MIESILDTDLYKFTQQQAVLELFPDTNVSYVFSNRNLNMTFTDEAFYHIKNEIKKFSELRLTDEEYEYIKSLRFTKPMYAEYLKNYRFNTNELQLVLSDEGHLSIHIMGKWHSTILWEVPLMAIISEVYFKYVDKDWIYTGQEEQAKDKALRLSEYCKFADFGTRRRRSYFSQDIVVRTMMQYSGFVGTSNVHFAMKYGVRPIGTVAHEWFMGVSALRGLRHANHNALYNWVKVYDADLGIALTDTYGTDSFFNDFDLKLAKTFDGVRHDSGDPFQFVDKVIAHYQKLNIDPLTKTIVFSDGLDVDLAIKLAQYCQDKIRCSFGIGTHFTNHYINHKGEKSKPLNMVIKLRRCDGIEVVKLSDNPAKAIGDRDAIRVAKWTFFNQPLDGE